MTEGLKLFGIGIIVGIANVIPGVSGGTIAVVFGVYDRLLAVVTPHPKKILRQWKFWLPLFLGLLAGILLFAKLVAFCFFYYPVPTCFFFIGLVAGSIPLMYDKTRSPQTVPPVTAKIACGAAFALMLVMLFAGPSGEGGAASGAFTTMTPLLFALLAVALSLAAVAMIIPGISGSFLLLALGVYRGIIGAVGSFVDALLGLLRGGFASFADFCAAAALPVLVLVPVFIGIVAGLFSGAALVRFLLKKCPKETYGAILGLVAGSIPVIFPLEGLRDGVGAFILVLSVLAAAAGFALAFFSGRKS